MSIEMLNNYSMSEQNHKKTSHKKKIQVKVNKKMGEFEIERVGFWVS